MTRTMKPLAWALLVLLVPATGLARPAETLAPEAPAESRADGRPPPASDRRIDLDFKNADIRDLLGILADVGGVVIVPARAVKARVSIRLRNAPWEKALDVLTRKHGLSYERSGKIIRVRKGR
jgi:type IV pilus assembly protein PilQ